MKAAMDRAHTFPLSRKPAPPSAQDHRAARPWATAAEVTPHAFAEQQRVCYPRLAAWSSAEDGPRALQQQGGPAAEKTKELKAADYYFGAGDALQRGGRWSIHVETARRRVIDEAAEEREHGVPTVMLVVYNDEAGGGGGGPGPEDIQLWVRACRDAVAFLRKHDAAYFGVEIVCWTQLDYGVFEPPV